MSDETKTPLDAEGGGAYADAAEQAQVQAYVLARLALHHGHKITQTHAAEYQTKLRGLRELSPALREDNSSDLLSDYLTDAFQRWVLFLDTLRMRGNTYVEREKEGFKPALAFDYDLIIDGRQLPRRVNYSLVRIRPPADFPPQRENGRPFVIIDPRAGHGSGIGGFKADSEVGVALRDGHPVYFVIFYPDPEPGQTLADICAAEATFLQEVHARHPTAPKPLVIGNCQGGWATMILSATHPDLMGPTVIAGAPLSYWSGELGKNPFRYLGGVSGGAVPALLAADLGAGRFDGAGLVLNFEQLNPANTWWKKYYDVLSNVDTKSEEFLKFESWWSGFYFMNENEIRWIIENLFIGNRLTRGEAVLPDGTAIDLTRIKAPVIVFASHGDNITPPQQALNWIADLYHSTEEIKARGHVIIYTLHDSIGHLGIFVSAKVATEHHQQIASVLKTIETLAPGLYEMKILQENGEPEVSFEPRAIADILAYDDGREEEAGFEAAAKVSEWATKTYELTTRPLIRAVVTPEIAEKLSALNPLRQQRALFSNENALMSEVEAWADEVRRTRKPVDETNPYLQLERLQAAWIEQSLNLYRDMRDAMIELSFHSIYGSPWMRAIADQQPHRPMTHEVTEFPEVQQALGRIEAGGYREAIVRMLMLLAHARGSIRNERLERSNRMLHSRPPFDTMSAEARARIIHEQDLIVQFTPEAALFGLRKLLFDDVERIHAINVTLSIAGPVQEMDEQTFAMFKRIQSVLLTYAEGWWQAAQEYEAQRAPQSDRPESE